MGKDLGCKMHTKTLSPAKERNMSSEDLKLRAPFPNPGWPRSQPRFLGPFERISPRTGLQCAVLGGWGCWPPLPSGLSVLELLSCIVAHRSHPC